MSPDPVVGTLLAIFLPFFLIGLLGNAAGLKPHQSFMPLRVLAMTMLNLFLFIVNQLFQLFTYFLASRTNALGRKKVRIKFTK